MKAALELEVAMGLMQDADISFKVPIYEKPMKKLWVPPG